MYAPIEAAVSLVFILLAFFLPYKRPQKYIQVSFKYLEKQYAKWELFAIVPLFIYIALIGYLLGNLFIFLSKQIQHKDLSLFHFYPNDVFWYGIASIFAFGFVAIPMDFTYKLLLRERYEEYEVYTNSKHNFDGRKAIRPISILLVGFSSLLLFCGLKYSIQIYPKKIVFNKFWSFKPKTQPIVNIKSIYFIEMIKYGDGQKSEPHHYIKFNDGSIWNTHDGLGVINQEDEMIEYLSKKTKIEIDTLNLDPD
ncbi:hypothetical protein [Pedobacter sp. UBA5917]|jgi:hypothetical protein|uniref:hypothetical protein n=1 Tax=Pedobacter sp. UBA5917 TaxID=1947061 RepID=UPI0025E70EFF|nr:hypothetical protein [Pedobacter sp. UBA5917]